MVKKEQHIHKYKRLRYKSGNEIFFCALPDCNQKINPALALGKRSLCWRCGEAFIMNEYALRLAKPHCEACHKPKTQADGFVEDDLEEQIRIRVEEHGMEHPDKILTLAERLQQTLHAVKTAEPQKEEEDEI
jgi:hypothetical protein